MNGSSPLRAEPQLALYLNYHTQNFGEVSAVREFLPGKSTIPCLRKEIPRSLTKAKLQINEKKGHTTIIRRTNGWFHSISLVNIRPAGYDGRRTCFLN